MAGSPMSVRQKRMFVGWRALAQQRWFNWPA
jgi:hypothetical protein